MRAVPFSIAAIIFVLDMVTKRLIERYVSLWDVHVVIPGFFQIIHTKNPGAAFSLLADSDSLTRAIVLIGFSLALLVFIAYMLWQATRPGSGEPWTSRTGLALVLGGAAGNVYDRIAYGEVTDFLDVYIGSYHWPTFNVADSAITIGAGLILLNLWRQRRQTA